MSETQESMEGSNVNNKLSSAVLVQRRAIARQAPDSSVKAAVPHPTTVEADLDAMFEDGRMVDAGDLMRKADEDPASDEEFLGLVAPQRLVKIDEKTDEGASKFLGMTREELIEYHAEKEMNDEGDVTVDASGAASFSITMHQEESEDKFAGLDDEVSNGGTHIAECPKCGAEDVTGSTVELQTRAADESGTQVTKTSCGCTLRNYD